MEKLGIPPTTFEIYGKGVRASGGAPVKSPTESEISKFGLI